MKKGKKNLTLTTRFSSVFATKDEVGSLDFILIGFLLLCFGICVRDCGQDCLWKDRPSNRCSLCAVAVKFKVRKTGSLKKVMNEAAVCVPSSHFGYLPPCLMVYMFSSLETVQCRPRSVGIYLSSSFFLNNVNLSRPPAI